MTSHAFESAQVSILARGTASRQQSVYSSARVAADRKTLILTAPRRRGTHWTESTLTLTTEERTSKGNNNSKACVSCSMSNSRNTTHLWLISTLSSVNGQPCKASWDEVLSACSVRVLLYAYLEGTCIQSIVTNVLYLATP